MIFQADPSIPLEAQQILQEIGPLACHLSQLDILSSVDSTQNYLMARRHFPSGYAVLAEQQTAGRGRLGRRWFSQGYHIHLSLLWHFQIGFRSLTHLYRSAGQAVIRALEANYFQGAVLKVPNDIFYQNKKLGGILIETFGRNTSPCQAIIGIGINVQHVGDPNQLPIDQAWIDINTVQPQATNRNRLAGLLLNQLLQTLLA